MVRYFFRISYIGTKYRGIQRQNSDDSTNETIQEITENALLTLEPENIPTTCFASRTDKGVHAIMNALHVDLDHKMSGEVYQPHIIRSKLNAYFAENDHDILITNTSVVPDKFHARFSAKWRSYYYRLAILNPEIQNIRSKVECRDYLPISEVNRCHVVPSELNTSMVKRVADLYCGEHDFTTFTKSLLREPWKNARRVIDECSFYEVPHHFHIADPQYSNISIWEFYIRSRAFLYHQVRKLVGTALSAGMGFLSLSDVKAMLENPGPDMWKKSFLPPPYGLYLAHVHYDKKAQSAFSRLVRKSIEIVSRKRAINYIRSWTILDLGLYSFTSLHYTLVREFPITWWEAGFPAKAIQFRMHVGVKQPCPEVGNSFCMVEKH